MKIGIIDDELHCIESLMMNLKEIEVDIAITLKSLRVDDALEQIARVDIDLLFIDVEMPRLNGFEFLDQLSEVNFEVVFTTAYSHYAVKAFKYKAFDYLLKPVSKEDLQVVLQKFHSKEVGKGLPDPELSFFIEQLKKDNIIKSKIAVPVAEGLEFVKVDDIIYAQSQNNYTLLFLSDGEKLLFSKTLKEVEHTLKKHLFIRIHQSFLINPNYMKKYLRNDGGGVLMENGELLPISQKNKEQIVCLFERIAKNKSL